MRKRHFIYRLISLAVALTILFVVGLTSLAQDEEVPAEDSSTITEVAYATTDEVVAVQFNLDQTWLLLTAFMVFFMQAGFAMLEGGMIRHTGTVNSMAENFLDAALTGIAFYAIGYGIAYGTSVNGLFGASNFFLNFADGTGAGDGALFVGWFFQFAFAGAAGTIATGAMAERTNFKGKIVYSIIIGLAIYPVVVHWIWGGGWLFQMGFHDFAGSTVVHQLGGIIALVGAIVVGPRFGKVFGEEPKPSNLMLATLGTMILWFGWYGFNVGSTLNASNPTIMGLVAVNTTLAACVASTAAMLFVYLRRGKWDLGFILNGSLAGLVAITAGCAFVSPIGAIVIGAVAGIVVVLAVDVIEKAKVDDAVGAFAVHGVCGMLGTLAIGFWGVSGLTLDGSAGLFMGGGVSLLVTQAIGVGAVALWAVATSTVMFVALNAIGILRVPSEADEIGIDAYEHWASLYGDLLGDVVPSKEPAGD